MTSSYLDLVKAKALDVMLQKEPTSKLLRGYLREALGLTDLPVLTTWEEWEQWLGSQTVKEDTPTASPNKASSSERDWEDSIPSYGVDVTFEREYKVWGRVSKRCTLYYNLSRLLNRFATYVEDTLEHIRNCRTVEEVDALDIQTLAEDLIGIIVEHQIEEDRPIDHSFEYDPGDIDVCGEEFEDESMDLSELQEAIVDFVDTYAEFWKDRLRQRD